MKYLLLIVIVFSTVTSFGQNMPAWKWAKSDTTAQISINPSYIRTAIGVSRSRVLWGYLKNKKTSYGSAAYGDNVLMEYDTLGAMQATANILGKVSFTSIDADSNGNWYVLATVYDSLRFSSGQTYTVNVFANESMNFLFRLHAGTLAMDWCRQLGTNYMTSVNLFTIQQNKAYLVTDSGLISKVWALNMGTGMTTQLLSQQGQSHISSLQADDRGNIYIAGSCANKYNGINFNGTQSIPINPNQYPSYVVRYRSNGQHDWHIWMTDNTCVPRKLTLVTNNFIYYSGAVHDTMTLGSYQLHKPVWLSSYMVSRLDSAGNVLWVNQTKDTVLGEGNLDYAPHAAASVDSSITLFAYVRGNLNLGSGMMATASNSGQAMCIHYNATGTPVWTKLISGMVTYPHQIAGNATNVWVTGAGRDSFSYKFDGITVPAALVYPPYMARLYTGAKTYSSGPTSVHTTAGDIKLIVQPNPATKSIAISGMENIHASVWISLTDMTGRVVCQKTLGTGTTATDIDVTNYSRGVYVLQVRGGGVQYVERVVLR